MAYSSLNEEIFAFTEALKSRPWFLDSSAEDYHNTNRACESYISNAHEMSKDTMGELVNKLSTEHF